MTVDRIVEREARDAPCRTHEIPLGQQIDPSELERSAEVPETAYAPLAARYGHQAQVVLAIASRAALSRCADRRGLPRPARPRQSTPRATSRRRGVADVLLRRTRLGLLAARAVTAEDTLERVGDVLAQELGWDPARRAAELARFQEEAAAEGSSWSR